MLGEKNITLLTPAVLHSTALEYLMGQAPSFHRKHIVRFSIMQGLWGCILYVLCVATVVLPLATSLRETSQVVLTNANFTQCEIKNGQFTSDIKPSIWSFAVSDNDQVREEVVVASAKSMNRFYWDDRIEKGMIKKVNGVSFMQEYVTFKQGTRINKLYYAEIFGNREIKMTKAQVYDFSQKITDRKNVLITALLGIPLIFVVSMLIGAVAHIIFIAVVGTVLALMTKSFSVNVSLNYKVASGLYVGWAYILVLSLIAQKILLITLADLASFFLVVNTMGLVAIVGIGYLHLRSLSQVSAERAINNVKKRK